MWFEVESRFEVESHWRFWRKSIAGFDDVCAK